MKLSQQLIWQPLTVGRSFEAAGFCSCFSSSSMSSASLRPLGEGSMAAVLLELEIDCGLQARKHVCASQSALRNVAAEMVAGARLTRKHAPSGVPSTAGDVSVRAGASCTHA